MRFVLEFEIEGLPKMSNTLLGASWQVRAGHAKLWKSRVANAVLPFKPPEPLAHAALELTRFSASEPDFDGLCSGFKSVVDGLVEAGVLQSDKPSCIGTPVFLWARCPRGKGHIRVRVEAK